MSDAELLMKYFDDMPKCWRDDGYVAAREAAVRLCSHLESDSRDVAMTDDPITPHNPSDFVFGETRVRSIWPGPTNPHRDGTFVEIIKREGRFNHGTYVRLTDCKGEFWEQEIGNVTIWQRGDNDETVTERANRMIEMIRKKREH